MERVLIKESAIINLPEKRLLADRLVSSLDFAKRTVRHLIIAGYAAAEDAPWYVRPEKIIAETAFLMVFAKAGDTYKQVEESISSLVKELEPLARSKTMLLNICLKPALALDYAHAHICLNYLGHPNEKFDAALTDALFSEAVNGIERTPYRMLEREWLLNLWDKSHLNGNLQFWIPLSILNHPVDVFNESSDGVYALTHAIMYASFSGKQIPGVAIDQLLQFVDALLVRYMDEQDYDISGELLMAWPLLGKPLSPIARFALDCMLNIEARVGFLPAPGLDPTMMDGQDQKARRTYIYSINYHTVLVMGLLCASQLGHFDAVAIPFIKDTYPTGLKNWLADELHSGKQSHWNEYFVKLNKEQKQMLIPWVYQAILARQIKERKYGLVKEMLKLSTGCILETLPMSRQARELLQRLGRNAPN